MKKPVTHTCKVTVVSLDPNSGNESTLELVVSDGTFMNEGLAFIKGELGSGSGNSTASVSLFDAENILEIGLEFDLPFDINNSGSNVLHQIVQLRNLRSFNLSTKYIQSIPPQIGTCLFVTRLYF